MKLCFVVQRYGPEVLGGSEHLCRLVAERLASQHEVDVLTTCARDYVTWKNEYTAGSDRVRGVVVRRFPTTRTRDIDAFNRYSEWIYNHAHTPAHDEPAIKLGIFKGVFEKPAALCFLTDSERMFVHRQFPDRPLLEEVVGVGVEIPPRQPFPRAATAATA